MDGRTGQGPGPPAALVGTGLPSWGPGVSAEAAQVPGSHRPAPHGRPPGVSSEMSSSRTDTGHWTQGPPSSGVTSPSLITSANPTSKRGGLHEPGSRGVGTWTHESAQQRYALGVEGGRTPALVPRPRPLLPPPAPAPAPQVGSLPPAPHWVPDSLRLDQMLSPQGPHPQTRDRPTLSVWGIRVAHLAPPWPLVRGGAPSQLCSQPGQPLAGHCS